MQATAMWTSDSPQECAVCIGLHDQDIHDATLSIHSWLRNEIQSWFEPQQFTANSTVEAVSATIPIAEPLAS